MPSSSPRTNLTAPALSSEYATALLVALAERGVRDIVVSPGSRSQALALAAAELEREGLVRLHVRIDERDGAFLALGLALGSSTIAEERVPAAVVTTSGSAVANLMPAVVEAARTGIPMLLVTADRPDAMRGTGANQTMEQAGIFGVFAADAYDVAVEDYAEQPVESAARFARLLVPVGCHETHRLFGPIHANIQFVEPLSGPHTPITELRERIRGIGPVEVGRATEAPGSVRTIERSAAASVVLAGFGADRRVVEAAAAAGVPVIAEITSGSRAYHSVADYRRWLSEGADGRRVCVVTGLPNLSREAWRFASRDDVELVAVAPRGHEYFSPQHRALRVDRVDFTTNDEVKVSSSLTSRQDVPGDGDVTRESIVGLVWRCSREHDAVYLAASNMVRVADMRVGASDIPVFSHRGLAGIDGTISAASGVAMSWRSNCVSNSDESGRLDVVGAGPIVRLIIGDLAFAHDIGGLLRPSPESQPQLQIVVVNDHGGSIFAGLEVANADPELYERVVRTAQPLDVQAVAAAYGWNYQLATTNDEVRAFLDSRTPGIVEVRISDAI
ncbi:2-succinyl-5-enolpyruvyl-6-hydroxy-3-cyclohexene-1-carboxylic-acid synthase [Arcanobacterium haemolyticum]|nr:2-succinyl-5-enolpyruvyl-6-hydroxy-3-cyclohexene-1-carboxylic-acid synthase [Arcanobacterium haemolyticum]